MKTEYSKLGRLQITKELIVLDNSFLPEALASIDFRTVKVDFDFANDIFTYTGISGLFDSLPQGAEAPMYLIIVNTKEGKFIDAEISKS